MPAVTVVLMLQASRQATKLLFLRQGARSWFQGPRSSSNAAKQRCFSSGSGPQQGVLYWITSQPQPARPLSKHSRHLMWYIIFAQAGSRCSQQSSLIHNVNSGKLMQCNFDAGESKYATVAAYESSHGVFLCANTVHLHAHCRAQTPTSIEGLTMSAPQHVCNCSGLLQV